MHARAQIDLNNFAAPTLYVDILSLKFEKDPLRGYGEIDVLLALYVSVLEWLILVTVFTALAHSCYCM